MLTKVNERKPIMTAADLPHVRIADAAFPAPFRSGLEYSSPARGTWNIVHTGMLIPEAHEIFVCAAGCLRGVVLTAAEMGTTDRFSTVAVRENNLLDGDLEDLVIEGVTDIINKLPKRPPAVLVYTSCVHHFAGVDLDMIYSVLRGRFPDIDFTDCYMNPIMRKSGLTPDQLMRSRLYMLLHEREKDPKAVAIIGNDLPTDEDSDLMKMLKGAGLRVHEITSCDTYDEYQEMAESVVYVSYNPDAAPGGDMLAERLGGVHYPLKFSFDYDEIDETFAGLAEVLRKACGSNFDEGSLRAQFAGSVDITKEPFPCHTGAADVTKELPPCHTHNYRELCEAELTETRELIGDTPVVIDYTYCPRPLGLARLLLDHGINVTKVYVDSIPGGDRPAFSCLQERYPDLMLLPTVHADMRFANSATRAEHMEEQPSKVLAIGQKAAYFEGTDHFVNIVEGGGMTGYEAIIRTCREMRDAYVTEKKMKDLVQIKGLGCEVCVR